MPDEGEGSRPVRVHARCKPNFFAEEICLQMRCPPSKRSCVRDAGQNKNRNNCCQKSSLGFLVYTELSICTMIL